MHQTCIACGRHVEWQDPDIPYCRDCEPDDDPDVDG